MATFDEGEQLSALWHLGYNLKVTGSNHSEYSPDLETKPHYKVRGDLKIEVEQSSD